MAKPVRGRRSEFVTARRHVSTVNGGLAVVCYHRVLAREDARSRPYFLRGTAVSTAIFRKHVENLPRYFECLDQSRALAVLRGEERLGRPGCWITFDDAYIDALHTAAPALREASLQATMFANTSVFAGETLPADRWYSILGNARRGQGTLELNTPIAFDLEDEQSYRRLVNGPERQRFLRASKPAQNEILERLGAALGVPGPGNDESLYLQQEDLTALMDQGWSVGSHGVGHRPLPGLSDTDSLREMSASRQKLKEATGTAPRVFAYPDGAMNRIAGELAKRAGYEAAVALGDTTADAGADLYAIPRLIARNDPRFIRRLAQSM